MLGIKNAGADGVYLPMAAATNVAVAQGLQQNGVDMKACIIATGYGQDFLDSPAAKSLPDSTSSRPAASRSSSRTRRPSSSRPT